MSLFAEDPDSRVMVFIDYRNIVECDPGKGYADVDLYRLTQVLVNGRKLMGAYVFDGRFDSYGRNDILHKRLALQGFRLVVRNSMVRMENGVYKQKELDVAMSVSMLEHALLDHYDTAIVLSGDRDFVPAIERVQEAGKRVEVAAYSKSYNEESKKAADIYYTLDDLPFLIARNAVEMNPDV